MSQLVSELVKQRPASLWKDLSALIQELVKPSQTSVDVLHKTVNNLNSHLAAADSLAGENFESLTSAEKLWNCWFLDMVLCVSGHSGADKKVTASKSFSQHLPNLCLLTTVNSPSVWIQTVEAQPSHCIIIHCQTKVSLFSKDKYLMWYFCFISQTAVWKICL